MSRFSLSTAEQGNNAHMPEDENRKKGAAGKGNPVSSLTEASAMPELAFDPIEAALRQLHESFAAEDIPDDFLDLLEQLDDRSAI